MRILVHDFSGHPFQIDLSRRLADRGHQVLHVHCPSYTTGKGRLVGGERLEVAEVALGHKFARYAPLRRLGQELAYGFRFTAVAGRFGPDVLISCNDPLGAKAVMGLWCWRRRLPWVFWLQDIYSAAMTRAAENRRLPGSRMMGRLFRAVEGWLLRSAGAVVAITEDFLPELRRWGVDPGSCTVIENWAPIEELPERARENGWRRDTGLGERFAFVYSGTLGLKHDPDLLYALAEQLDPDHGEVVVVSEGLGIDRLRELQSVRELSNLRLLPFQPYSAVPEVLGAADVLLVLLEPDAGLFSVPSKVLTCLCAGRPILAAMPAENLAAKTIERVGAGTVVAPGRTPSFIHGAMSLMSDDELRTTMGKRARAYAEGAFGGGSIAERFEAVLEQAVGSAATVSPSYDLAGRS